MKSPSIHTTMNKRRTIKHLLICLLTMYYGTSVAQETTFSLQQAISYALQHESSVLNAQLDEQISKQKVNEILGLGTPQIAASAELNNFLDIPVSFVPGEFFGGEAGTFFPVQFGQQYSASAGFSASQLLFDGTYIIGLQASKTFQELSRKQTHQTKTETAVKVSKAYYGALVANARMEIIEANLQRVDKILSDTRALYAAGFVEKIDVDRLELTRNNLLVEKEKLERYVLISYALLKFQMNYPRAEAITLTDKIEEPAIGNVTIPDSVDVNNRPEFQLVSVSRRLQEMEVKRYRASYLPTFAAFGAFSYNNARNSFDIFNSGLRWFPTTIVGAKLSIPIWDGLQKRSQVAQAKLSLQKTDNSMLQMKNGFQLELEGATANFKNNLSSLTIVKKNRDLAEEIALMAKIKYESGVGSSLEVVDAESAKREADANYINTLYETIIARIDLDKASGLLTY